MSPYLEQYIFAFSQLGFLIEGFLQRLGLTRGIKDDFFAAVRQSVERNMWFTEDSIRQSLAAISADMLSPARMEEWLSRYGIPDGKPSGSVGIIMAGNIPLVGFHDLLCALASGRCAVVKLSAKDAYLLPMLVKFLRQIDHRFAPRVTFADDLRGVDAVVATGSSNSSRYFELYYGRLPHIFRKSRTSVAVISGSESDERLRLLAHDALGYFGLGCRSVGKVFIPEGYDVRHLGEAFAPLACLREHKPYDDCCRYAKALLQMHRRDFFDLGGCIATFSDELSSPVGTLFLQRYQSAEELQGRLLLLEGELQCVAADAPVAGLEPRCVPFGQAQRPRLTDYSDGVDTLQFLLSLP
ncbi:MAG: aldehyde dehydrogenase [Prevotellaceae bacterium]|nr:aldehyde dehydrogenase [Prevotellaceae bacterium]